MSYRERVWQQQHFSKHNQECYWRQNLGWIMTSSWRMRSGFWNMFNFLPPELQPLSHKWETLLSRSRRKGVHPGHKDFQATIQFESRGSILIKKIFDLFPAVSLYTLLNPFMWIRKQIIAYLNLTFSRLIFSGTRLSLKWSFLMWSLNRMPQDARESIEPTPWCSKLWHVKAILESKPKPA